MIGFVSPSLQPLVRLTIRSQNGEQEVEVDAIVDTGFNGYLTLPSNSIQKLGLESLPPLTMVLADSSVIEVETCEAEVLFNGVWRETDIVIAENTPFLGLAFLENHQLVIEVRDGGAVSIETL